MPASLLQSQFDVLEEPLGAERALFADVAQPTNAVVAAIIAQLGSLEVSRGQ